MLTRSVAATPHGPTAALVNPGLSTVWMFGLSLAALSRGDNGADLEARAFQCADDIVDVWASEVHMEARLPPPSLVPQLLQLAVMSFHQGADGGFRVAPGSERDDDLIERLVALEGTHAQSSKHAWDNSAGR